MTEARADPDRTRLAAGCGVTRHHMPLASRVRPTPTTPDLLPRRPQFVRTRYLSSERVTALAQGAVPQRGCSVPMVPANEA